MLSDSPTARVLLPLTAVAASTDAISYLGLGAVFPANMTGNTVLLAIGIATGQGLRAARSAVALGGFVAGAIMGGLLGARRGRRSPLVYGIALELVVIGAACGWWLALGDHPASTAEFGLIALMSFAMGVQSAVITSLGVGVSTTFITGTWTAVSSWAAHRFVLQRPATATGQDTHARQAAVLACYFSAALLAAYLRHVAGAAAIAVPTGLLLIVESLCLVSSGRRRSAPPATNR